MTTQTERAVQSIAVEPSRRRWSWRALAVGASILLAGTGVAVGLVATHGKTVQPQPPNAILGQSLHPLAVYQVVLGAQPGHTKAGEMTVPEMGRPGQSAVLRTRPVTNLQVRYAHVRPVVGHWEIEFIAPKGDLQSTSGKFFDVLVDGKALTLFTIGGSSDGTNFGIGAGPNSLTAAQAVAVARSLTTSVTVAHCSQSAIDANECI